MNNLPDISKLPPRPLLPSQELIHQTSELVFGDDHTFIWRETPPSALNAGELRASVAQALGNALVLPEGKTYRLQGYGKDHIDFTPGAFGPAMDATAHSDSLLTEKRRRISAEELALLGEVDPLHVIPSGDEFLVDFDGFDWHGNAGVIFWHSRGEGQPRVGEMITAHTRHSRPEAPTIEANLFLSGNVDHEGRRFFPVAEVRGASEETVAALLLATRQVVENPRH